VSHTIFVGGRILNWPECQDDTKLMSQPLLCCVLDVNNMVDSSVIGL